MINISNVVKLVRVVLLCWLAFLPLPVFADTCECQEPCSGSKTCSGGCYAFCEENPEGSGRHVCVKGCASETTESSAISDDSTAVSLDTAEDEE